MNRVVLIQGIMTLTKKNWQKAFSASPFAANVVLTFATNVLLAGLGFVTGVLAARLLGPEGRGELAAIQMWPSFIASIAMLGLPEALVYFSARDPDRAGQYLGSAMSLAFLSSIPFMAAGFVFMPLLLSAQPDSIVKAARWYLILVPLFTLVGLPYHPLRGKQDFIRWNALRLLPNLGWLVVLCFAFIHKLAEPGFLAGAYLVMLGILFIPVMIVVLRRIPGPYQPQCVLWRPMAAFGLPSVASSLPQMLNHRLDQMVIAAFLPSHSLGLYVIAVAWGNTISPLLSAIGIVAFPKIAGEQKISRQIEILAQTTRLAVFFSLLFGGLLSIITPWVLPLVFGDKFQQAVPVALIMVIAGVFWGLNLVLEDGLRGLGQPNLILFAEVSGVIISIIGLIIMLPKFGIMGAAMASLFASCSITVVLIFWVQKITREKVSAIICPRWGEIRFRVKNILIKNGLLKS